MNITRFKIKGRAHSSKINNLIRKGFKLKNISSEGKSLVFDDESKNEKNISAYCEEMSYDYSVVKRTGPKHTFFRLLSNNGLFFGLIVSLLLLILCSLFVFDINIVGADRIENAVIMKAVENSGAKRFKLIYGINERAIMNNVLAIEGISSASVETKGVKLYVYVKEELEEPDINDYSKPIPVVSAYDAVVTRIVVLTGTAAVKKGDTVTKGEVLISPYITNKKSEDEEKEEIRIDIRATGIVYGRVWYKESYTLTDEIEVYERTGRYIETVTPTYIFEGKSPQNIPYKHYEIEEEKIYYNAFFPLIVTYNRYYELEKIIVKRNVQMEKEEIIAESYLKLKSRVPDDAKIIRYWSTVKEVDNSTLIDVYLETEQRIDDGGEFGED